jgi:Zn finger protein HypA/HybF involved in hydrogenase expression
MKEYRRICKRCETQWYVPAQLAKERASSRLEIASRKTQAAGSSMSLISFSKSRDQAKLANAENKRQRVLDNARCPSCGSTKYTQTRAPRA